MNTYQRGFIPLVAVVLLGLTVVGGSATAIYLQDRDKPEDQTTVAEEKESGPISQNLEVSEDSEGRSEVSPQNPALSTQQENLEARGKISNRTREICTQAGGIQVVGFDDVESTDPATQELKENRIHARESLAGDIRALCETLQTQDLNREEAADKEQHLVERWSIWLQTQEVQAQAEPHYEHVREYRENHAE